MPVRGRPGKRVKPFVAMAVAPLLALSACGDNRTDAKQQDEARSAKLVLPTSITPPVHIASVSGAPSGWKLADKVATALRQRDIPAGSKLKRSSNYRLAGTLRRGGADRSQLIIRWTLTDPAGKKVGEVTQMAALTPGQKPNEDILESIADAAAESLSPIIPSSKLQTARKFDTGEPTSRPPKEAHDKNRVTAVGKIKTRSPLSRNLLNRQPKPAPKAVGGSAIARGGLRGDGSTGVRDAKTSVTTSNKSVTAIGRMQPGKSALSRNLIRGGSTGTGRTVTGNDSINTQGTTSRRPRRPVADTGPEAPRGTMTELFRRYPTSMERRSARTPVTRNRSSSTSRGVARSSTTSSRIKRSDRVARKSRPQRSVRTRRVANNRYGVARDFTPRVRGQVADAANRTTATRRSGRRSYRWWVQIGSYGSRAEGTAQWEEARARARGPLFDATHRVVRKNLGRKGVWYRLQVGPPTTKTAALRLCRRLKAAKIDCFIVPERYRGTPAAVTPKVAKPKATPPKPAAPRTAARPPVKAPPKVNQGETTSNVRPKPPAKAEATPPVKPAAPPNKGGNGMSVYEWKTAPDKKPNPKEPPLSTRPGIPGVTQ